MSQPPAQPIHDGAPPRRDGRASAPFPPSTCIARQRGAIAEACGRLVHHSRARVGKALATARRLTCRASRTPRAAIHCASARPAATLSPGEGGRFRKCPKRRHHEDRTAATLEQRRGRGDPLAAVPSGRRRRSRSALGSPRRRRGRAEPALGERRGGRAALARAERRRRRRRVTAGAIRHTARPAAQVSELRSGSPSVCSQWLTVMLSCVNSPVQIRMPIPISTTPPRLITTA